MAPLFPAFAGCYFSSKQLGSLLFSLYPAEVVTNPHIYFIICLPFVWMYTCMFFLFYHVGLSVLYYVGMRDLGYQRELPI